MKTERTSRGKPFHFWQKIFGWVFLLHLVRQFAEVCASNLPGAKLRDLETTNDVLQGGRYHKVFLLQTELLSFKELRIKTHICLFLFCRRTWKGFLFFKNILCIFPIYIFWIFIHGQLTYFHFVFHSYCIFVYTQICSSL